jgi:hypothetical protein
MRERVEQMRKQAEEQWDKSDDGETEVIEKEYTSPDGSTKIKVKIVRKVSKPEDAQPEQPKEPEDSKAEPAKSEEF